MNARWLSLTAVVLILGYFVLHQDNSLALLNREGENDKFQNRPSLMLWAWEYPCDLQFIDIRKTGVAYLAGTIVLTGNNVLSKPRLQTLKVKGGTFMTAVVRIETDRRMTACLSDEQLNQLVSKIIELVEIKPAQAVQIDFDAKQSERSFYRNLLKALAKRLPSGMPLSITSLASWCLGDTWIKDLPCDEVVPMFFSMGKDRQRVLTLLQSKRVVSQLSASKSFGLCIDEPDVIACLPMPSRHVYLFSEKGWNSKSAIAWVRTFELRSTH